MYIYSKICISLSLSLSTLINLSIQSNITSLISRSNLYKKRIDSSVIRKLAWIYVCECKIMERDPRAWLSLRWVLLRTEALEELRVAAKISEEEGDTPTLSYIRDLIEQLNRALREVTFGEDQCLKGALRRLSPRSEETGLSEGNEAITTSGIRRMSTSRVDDALTPSFYSDCLEDEILDPHKIGIKRSFRIKRYQALYL